MYIENEFMCGVMEFFMGIDKRVLLFVFCGQMLFLLDKFILLELNLDVLVYGCKVVIYVMCYGNFNNIEIGFVV